MAFKDVVKSVEELRALMGEPSELALRKDIGRLDHHCRAFIARSPFVLISTADRSGRCDVSPKGDAPGFVEVLDEGHLIIPDRPGNKRYDGIRNLIENPGIGLTDAARILSQRTILIMNAPDAAVVEVPLHVAVEQIVIVTRCQWQERIDHVAVRQRVRSLGHPRRK